jgi:hypothetical protein
MTKRLPATRRLLCGAGMMLGSWLALGACNGSPVGVVDDDAGGSEGGGDATSEASGDATVEVGPDAPMTNDTGTDVTMTMSDASADANEGGVAEASAEATGAEQ